jgi:selenocysteine-specific elongation factor
MKNAKRLISDPSGKGHTVVFGIAGHTGHGKSALFKALTGVKAGSSAGPKVDAVPLDFSVANLELPNGCSTVIVDVPGDPRAIKNTLAALGGIDVLLLAIAADDRIQSQTRDHFHACRLLNVCRGIIVITKSDLADAGRISQLDLEIRDCFRNTFLDTASCIAVSAEHNSGMAELKAQMARVAQQVPPPQRCSFARLPIDRCFKMERFGTVVTGKLHGGILRQGEMVEIHPMRRICRIRGIQVQRKAVLEAVAGQRVAVNLAGIEARQVQTGCTLTIPDTLESSNIFDAVLHWVNAKYVPRLRQSLKLYVGGAESSVEVRLIYELDAQRTFSRISSREPLLVLPHDRLILRNSEMTIAGGLVLDPEPPIRLRREKTIERLQALQSGGDAARLRLLLEESSQGRKISNIVRLTGWMPAKIKKLVEADDALTLFEREQRVVTLAWLEQKRQQVLFWLRQRCSRAGAPRRVPLYQVRSSFLSGIEPEIADFILRSIPQIAIAEEHISLVAAAAEDYGLTSEPSIPLTVVQESPGRIGCSGYFEAKSSLMSIPNPGSSLP